MAAQFERELSPFDVTLAQWGAMLAIRGQDGASPSQVAATVGIDRGATTRLIARMESKGLVAREGHSEDARSIVLRLTPKARAMMPQLVARSRKVNREALALLDAQDAEALLAALNRLLVGLRVQD